MDESEFFLELPIMLENSVEKVERTIFGSTETLNNL